MLLQGRVQRADGLVQLVFLQVLIDSLDGLVHIWIALWLLCVLTAQNQVHFLLVSWWWIILPLVRMFQSWIFVGLLFQVLVWRRKVNFALPFLIWVFSRVALVFLERLAFRLVFEKTFFFWKWSLIGSEEFSRVTIKIVFEIVFFTAYKICRAGFAQSLFRHL